VGDVQRLQTRFVAVAAALSVISLALIIYLLWPGSSRSAQQQEKAGLEQQSLEFEREVAEWENSNPERTRTDLKLLYTQVPSRYSQISQRMEKLFQESGVNPSASIKYSSDSSEKTDLPDVQRIKVDTTVTGDYQKVARFINAMEQDPLLFVIQKISLSNQTEGGGVALQISFETFLKGAA
jgi:hypothetical protein